MSTIAYQGLKITPKGEEEVFDVLTEEGALQITINGKPFSITMRTPGYDDDLVRGLLYLEGVYIGKKSLTNLEDKQKTNVLDNYQVEIPIDQLESGYSNSRNLLSASSCGICGKTTLEDIRGKKALSDNDRLELLSLQNMYTTFQNNQGDFEKSGGSHASAVFDLKGNLLSLREDIGRHNAVDKVVGDLLNSNKLKEAKVLLLSGRISYELIAKAFKAKIPIVAAISAPSSLAVDFAKELGITILGFCRENRATCYAHPQRIK